jgi:hypothetical protein
MQVGFIMLGFSTVSSIAAPLYFGKVIDASVSEPRPARAARPTSHGAAPTAPHRTRVGARVLVTVAL